MRGKNIVEITLKTDFRDASKALAQIEDVFKQRTIVQSSLRASMKPMLQMSKVMAAQTSGALAESLKLQSFRKGRRLGKNVARVIIRSKVRDKIAVNKALNYYGITQSRLRGGAKHAHLVEFGYTARDGGKDVGARPFLRPAFTAGALPMIQSFRSELGKKTKRELKRIANKRLKR